jgi:hypothetical protein
VRHRRDGAIRTGRPRPQHQRIGLHVLDDWAPVLRFPLRAGSRICSQTPSCPSPASAWTTAPDASWAHLELCLARYCWLGGRLRIEHGRPMPVLAAHHLLGMQHAHILGAALLPGGSSGSVATSLRWRWVQTTNRRRALLPPDCAWATAQAHQQHCHERAHHDCPAALWIAARMRG